MSGQACRNAILDAPRELGTHAGLLLMRFLRVPVKDAEEKHPKERRALYAAAIKACELAAPLYRLAFNRRRELLRPDAENMLSVQGRLIVGLGGENVLETGITLHHTYGTPLIPGTALKGLAAHYCDQVWGKKDPEFGRESTFQENGQEKKRPGLYYRELFGTTDDSGHIIFHDAWIKPESLTSPHQGLVLDVMTPHHGDYYMAKPTDDSSVPTDCDSPKPVTFLSVVGTFHVAVSCDVPGETGKKWALLALTLLSQALSHWGIGGKTNAGYGRMVDSSQTSDPSSLGQQETAAASPGPRFKPGDQVTVKRIEDPKGRNRIWFQAEDGFGGVVTRGVAPPVQVGDTVSLWIAAVSNGYNFSTESPQLLRTTRGRGRRTN